MKTTLLELHRVTQRSARVLAVRLERGAKEFRLLMARNSFVELKWGLAVLIVAVHSLIGDSALGQGFQAEGILTYTINGQLNVRSRFSMTVDSCRWKLRLKNDGGTAFNGYPVLYIELWNAEDGIYRKKVFDGAQLRRTIPNETGTSRMLVTNLVSVYKGSVPIPDGFFAIGPWLAYGSTCYLQTNEARIRKILTMNMALFEDGEVTVPINIHYTADSSRFPNEIAFLNEGFYYIPKGNGQSVGRRQLLAPFKEGFVENLYQVHEFTKVSNMTVPRKFSISYFSPKRGATSSTDLLLTAKLEAEATNVIATSMAPTASTTGTGERVTAVDSLSVTADSSRKPGATSTREPLPPKGEAEVANMRLTSMAPMTSTTGTGAKPVENSRSAPPASLGQIPPTVVFDHRVKTNGNPVKYFTTGDVYSLNDPRLEAKRKVQERRNALRPKPLSATRIGVLVGLFALTAACVLGMLFFRKRKIMD